MGKCRCEARLIGTAEVFQHVGNFCVRGLEEQVTDKGRVQTSVPRDTHDCRANNDANCSQNKARTNPCRVLVRDRNLFSTSFHNVFMPKQFPSVLCKEQGLSKSVKFAKCFSPVPAHVHASLQVQEKRNAPAFWS